MTEPKTTRIPAPLYAAAGAGDYAYEQLRKLPAVVNDLSGKAALGTAELREKANLSTAELREKANLSTAELRERATLSTAELREKAAAALRHAETSALQLRERTSAGELDVDRLREIARRNTAAVIAGAQVAQERALAAYTALVARGERVVGTGVVQAAETVNADIEATEAPAEVTATPADVAEVVDAKPVVGATPADVAEVVDAKPVEAKPGSRNIRPAARSTKGASKPAGPGKSTGPAKGTRPDSIK